MTPERKASVRKELTKLYREEQIRAGRAAEPPATPKVERHRPLPGQAVGDAKDPLIRIEEAGFDPVRYREDSEYATRFDSEHPRLVDAWIAEKAKQEKAETRRKSRHPVGPDAEK